MQITEVVAGSAFSGQVHYFTAVLFKGWEFWTAGPSGHSRERVLLELALYIEVEQVQLVQTYVPYIT